MAEVFVDSCVLLDVFNDDANFGAWSVQTLYDCQKTNELVINTIIFSEVALNFDSCIALESILGQLKIRVLTIPLAAAFDVSRVFRQYKNNKGDRKSAMPDFYIGAHARQLNVPIITRDVARFRTYFPELTLITPE